MINQVWLKLRQLIATLRLSIMINKLITNTKNIIVSFCYWQCTMTRIRLLTAGGISLEAMHMYAPISSRVTFSSTKSRPSYTVTATQGGVLLIHCTCTPPCDHAIPSPVPGHAPCTLLLPNRKGCYWHKCYCYTYRGITATLGWCYCHTDRSVTAAETRVTASQG